MNKGHTENYWGLAVTFSYLFFQCYNLTNDFTHRPKGVVLRLQGVSKGLIGCTKFFKETFGTFCVMEVINIYRNEESYDNFCHTD